MSRALALSLEQLNATTHQWSHIRCVALRGRQPGLRIRDDGSVAWQSDMAVAGELWMADEGRLVLTRPLGAAPVTLHRAGRSHFLSIRETIAVLDDDVIEVSGQRLQVFNHGPAATISPPSHMKRALGAAKRAAATVAVGAAVVGCNPQTTPQYEAEAPTAPSPTEARPEAEEAGPDGSGASQSLGKNRPIEAPVQSNDGGLQEAGASKSPPRRESAQPETIEIDAGPLTRGKAPPGQQQQPVDLLLIMPFAPGDPKGS